MIEMVGITKRFGGVMALEGVSLRVEGGRVHGLLGENGAGKTTLMKVLFGLVRADVGVIKVAGEEVRIGSPRAAQRLGIGMVHQHFMLVGTLTVEENLALALGVSVRRAKELGRRWEKELPWEVAMGVRVERLSVGEQQRVEIVKALLAGDGARATGPRDCGQDARTPSAGRRVLILDEPTAVLTPQETGELFGAIGVLKKAGHGVVFISHKLGEVEAVCDEVTILRRGRVVYAGERAGIGAGEMAEKMVGRVVSGQWSVASGGTGRGHEGAKTTKDHEDVLELQGVSLGRMRGVSLRVRRGEIVGVAGVDGNGQTELVQAVVGAERAEAGRIVIGGEDATGRSIRWRGERMAYIAEDRQRQAVVMPLNVEQNLMLKGYRGRRFSTLGWLRFGAWREQAEGLVKQFDVRCESVEDTVGQLSGGNQQKVVLARELGAWSGKAKALVVAVNPTRGLDVGATAFVMEQLLAARERGAGVLLVHSDLDELLALSDRVVVMYGGRMSESGWPAETKEGIGRRMVGAARIENRE